MVCVTEALNATVLSAFYTLAHTQKTAHATFPPGRNAFRTPSFVLLLSSSFKFFPSDFHKEKKEKPQLPPTARCLAAFCKF